MATINEQQIILDIQSKVDNAKTLTSLREIKQAIRDLQGEALTYQDVSEGAFQAAQTAAGELKDRLADVQAQTAALSGEPLENVSNSINLVSSSLSSLDFTQASTGIKLLATNISKIKLSDVATGVKSVGSAFLDLGKALLTNPLFLLGSALVLIISKFNELKEIGGVIGDIFKGIGNAIELVIDTVKGLGDALGLTNTKANMLKDTLRQVSEAQDDLNKKQQENAINIAKLKGESTIMLEWQQKINDVSNSQKDFNTNLDETIKKYPKLKDVFGKSYKEASDLIIQSNIKDEKQRKDALDGVKKYYDAVLERDNFYKTNKVIIDLSRRKTELDNEEKIAQGLTNIRERERRLLEIANKRAKLDRDKENSKYLNDVAAVGDIELNQIDKQIKDKRDLIQQSNVKLSDLQTQYNNLNIKDAEKLYANLTQEQKNYIDNNYARETRGFSDQLVLKEDGQKKVIEMTKYNIKEQIDIEKNKNKSLLFEEKKLGDDRRKTFEEKSKDLLSQKKNISDSEIALDKKANREKREIALRQDMAELQARQATADAKLKQETDNAENAHKLGKTNYATYQDELLQAQLKYQSISEELTIKKYKKEYQLAEGNAKVQKEISNQLEAYIKGRSDLVETLLVDTGTKITKHFEDIKKERESIAKEFQQIRLDILKTNEDIFTQQANNDTSELQRLSMGTNAYKGSFKERLEVQKDFNINALAAIELQRQQEIAVAESKGQDLTAINEKYNEKIKNQTAQNEEAIAAIKIQQIERVQYYSQKSIEGVGLIADIAANMDAQRLKKGEKLSFKAASKQFVAKQALAATSVIVDTGAAIMRSVAESPETGGLPFSAIAGAMGALQLAKILSTKFEYNESSSSASSGSAGSTTAPSAPSMASAPSAPAFSQGFLNTINPASYIQYKSREQYKSQRVYVVESDITRTQTRVEVQQSRANLGQRV